MGGLQLHWGRPRGIGGRGARGAGRQRCRVAVVGADWCLHRCGKILQKLKVSCSRGGSGNLGKGERTLIKHDVSRDDNSICGGVKTPVPFVVEWITKKNTHGGGEVWIALASEDAEMCVGGVDSIKGKEQGLVVKCFGWVSVDKVGGGVEGLNPKGVGKASLEE